MQVETEYSAALQAIPAPQAPDDWTYGARSGVRYRWRGIAGNGYPIEIEELANPREGRWVRCPRTWVVLWIAGGAK